MTKITPTSIIQQIVAASANRPKQAQLPVGSATQFLDTEPKRDKKVLLKQLKATLAKTADPEQHGIETIIKEVLRWEFGESITEAHHFNTTAARIEFLLNKDPRAAEKLKQLIKALTKSK